MPQQLRLRRAAAAGTVLLLHLLAVLALLAAFRPQMFFGAREGVREISITLPVQTRTQRIEPVGIPPPEFLSPEISPRAITPPALVESPGAVPSQQEQQGDIRALGRYLTNCSGAYYERLSPREKAHCLDNKWNGQEGPALALGPAKPSPYDAVIAKRNEKAVPIEHPCPVDKPTSNLGLPCYDFGSSEEHQPMVEFRH